MNTRIKNVISVAMLVMLMTVSTGFGDLPVVPGYSVEVYVNLTTPVTFCFAPDGVMYVGNRDPSSEYNRAYRVEPGGSWSYYGPPMWKAGTVGYDRDGLISGTAGSLLAAGGTHFTAILPPGDTAKLLWTGPFGNLNDIAFDSTGRMLLVDVTNRNVYWNDEGTLKVLLTAPLQDCKCMAIDRDDNIFISMGHYDDARILAYDSTGNPIGAPILHGQISTEGPIPITFGKGGVWGYSLYVLVNHVLMRFDSPLDSPDSFTTIGTGFSKICYQYMQFGPDGALYVSTSLEHRIFRIAPMNPVDLLEDLVLLVITVNENNDITNSSLEAKLNAALNTLDDLNENNNVAAINTLGNFIKAVENQLDKGDISPEDAQDLIDAAQDIIDLLTNG